ncbi:MAG TPA: winged helix-turn-helix transcriptional regulator [Thermoplasmata archaeon]|nr:winged helix-turn-helix transcriptional regulator [Thermoplasmata archaeon]
MTPRGALPALVILVLLALAPAAAGRSLEPAPSASPIDPAGAEVLNLTLTPSTAVAGELVTLNATVRYSEPANLSAEYFLDRVGTDGDGVPLTGDAPPPGVYSREMGAVLDTAGLPAGDHLVFVHAQVETGLWGKYVAAALRVVFPELTLSMAADTATATPGSLVGLTVTIQDAGTAPPLGVQLDLVASEALSVASDNAAGLGAVRWGRYSYGFGPLPENPAVLRVDLLVSPTARDGAVLGVTASLQYASSVGMAYGPLHAQASLEVRAVEMALSVRASSARVFPGDTVIVEAVLDRLTTRTVPEIFVDLDPGPWLALVESNVADLGGEFVGSSTLRFRDVPPGPRTVLLTLEVSRDAPDGAAAEALLAVRFVDRLGNPFESSAAAEFTIARPVLALDVLSESPALQMGASGNVTVRVRNFGTAAALGTLRLDTGGRLRVLGASLPYRLEGDLVRMDLGEIPPGERGVSLVVASLAGDGRLGTIAASLDFATPTGTPLGTVADDARLILIPRTLPPSLPPPPDALTPGSTLSAVVAVLAAVSLVGLAGTERGKTGFLFLFIPLYTRLKREEILDHETRGMIRGYVLANPGDHFNAIKETLELNNGTLAYHLNVLEKEGIIRSVKDGKFRRFFPSEMKIPHNGELPTKVQRLILEMVLETPAIAQKEISRVLGLSQSTVSYHLDRLRELGLVRAERRGMQLCYFVLPDGIEIVTAIP